MKIVLAILLSSASVVPAYFAVLALSGDLQHALLPQLLLGSFAVSLVAVTLVALPLHFALAGLGRRHLLNYALVGFALPLLVTLVLNPFGTDVSSWVKWQALVMGLMGAFVASIFWRVAVR